MRPLSSKYQDDSLKSMISIITLNVNDLNTPLKNGFINRIKKKNNNMKKTIKVQVKTQIIEIKSGEIFSIELLIFIRKLAWLY